jgi:hypothetical protein
MQDRKEIIMRLLTEFVWVMTDKVISLFGTAIELRIPKTRSFP